MAIWNPWHGCKKFSPGCAHCYVYRRDNQFDRDSSQIKQTASFSLPLQKDRQGYYQAWEMIRLRRDLEFVIITKRIHRFSVGLPLDWGEGYPNVTIVCTCENQQTADQRLPVLLSLPIRHREIIHEPMLEEI